MKDFKSLTKALSPGHVDATKAVTEATEAVADLDKNSMAATVGLLEVVTDKTHQAAREVIILYCIVVLCCIITYHISHTTHRTSHITHHISHHMSHITHHTSTYHISHISHYTTNRIKER